MPQTLFLSLLGPLGALLEPLYAFVFRPALLLRARLRALSPSAPMLLVDSTVASFLAVETAPSLPVLSSGSVVAVATGIPLRPSSLPLLALLLAALAGVPTALIVLITLTVLTAPIALHAGDCVLDPVGDSALALLLSLSSSMSAALGLLPAELLARLLSAVLFSLATSDTGAAPLPADLLAVELVLGAALVPASLLAAAGLLTTERSFPLAASATAELFAALLVPLSAFVTSIVLIHGCMRMGTSKAVDAPAPLAPASN